LSGWHACVAFLHAEVSELEAVTSPGLPSMVIPGKDGAVRAWRAGAPHQDAVRADVPGAAGVR